MLSNNRKLIIQFSRIQIRITNTIFIATILISKLCIYDPARANANHQSQQLVKSALYRTSEASLWLTVAVPGTLEIMNEKENQQREKVCVLIKIETLKHWRKVKPNKRLIKHYGILMWKLSRTLLRCHDGVSIVYVVGNTKSPTAASVCVRRLSCGLVLAIPSIVLSRCLYLCAAGAYIRFDSPPTPWHDG